METDAQGTRIQGFDGLRAIAFVLVFFSHKIKFADANVFGGVGVWLFFVLSGFLITRILATTRSEIEAGRSTFVRSLRHFYIRRSARIFPPYYLLLAVVTVVSLAVPIYGFWRPEKLAYLTYTTNIMIGNRDYWPGQFGHLWTLAIEEQFYVLFAPLVLLVPRRYTLAVCLSIMLLAVATRVGLEMADASAAEKDVNSFVNFGLLAWGGIVGLNAHRKLPAWALTGSAQLAGLAAFIGLASLMGNTEEWRMFDRLTALIAGFLLLQTMQGQGSWLVGALESPPLRDLGRISYGAYLVHNFIFIAPLIYGIEPDALGFGAQWVVATAAEFVLTIGIATLSWRYMEKPIIAWARRVTTRKALPMNAARAPALQSEA